MSLPIDDPASDAAALALRRRAEDVGQQLQSAVQALLAQLQQNGARDQKALQAALHIGQSAVSRLQTSVRSGDPLATLGGIPGQIVLAQMIQGAARSGVDAACVDRVAAAVQAFEQFVDSEFGDRAELDAVLSEWLLESRGGFELRQKTAAFKAMSALRGVQAQTVLSTAIVHPAAEGERHDGIALEVMLGCRRLKPSGVLRLNFSSLDASTTTRYRPLSLGGKPVAGIDDLLVPDFSTVRPAQIHTQHRGRVIETTVSALPLGRGQGRGQDLVYAQVYNGMQRSRRGDGEPTSGMAGHAEPPSECCVVDALLHDDVWPGIQPELRLYDTVIRGIAHPDDPARFSDRLDMVESVQFLGRGPDAFRLPEFLRYPELVRQACAARGWDANRLRGYRVKVRYPIYGTQIGMAFRLPD